MHATDVATHSYNEDTDHAGDKSPSISKRQRVEAETRAEYCECYTQQLTRPLESSAYQVAIDSRNHLRAQRKGPRGLSHVLGIPGVRECEHLSVHVVLTHSAFDTAKSLRTLPPKLTPAPSCAHTTLSRARFSLQSERAPSNHYGPPRVPQTRFRCDALTLAHLSRLTKPAFFTLFRTVITRTACKVQGTARADEWCAFWIERVYVERGAHDPWRNFDAMKIVCADLRATWCWCCLEDPVNAGASSTIGSES